MSRNQLWTVVLVGQLLCVSAFAQDPPEVEKQKQPPDAKATTRQALDIYLWDRGGNLVLVPDVSFEDFEEYYQRKQELIAPEPPAYSIQSVDITGLVDATHADLTVKLQVLVTAKRTGRIPIRLGFGNALRTAAQYRGEGDQFINFEQDEYVCWLKAAESSQHALTVRFLVPLRIIGGRTRLPLQLPRAPTHLAMQVNAQGVVATVDNERSSVKTKNSGRAKTEIQVDGLGGDLTVEWQRRSATPTPAKTVLGSDAKITVDVENQHHILVTGEIEVRTYSGLVESFEVRLPPGMTLITRDQPIGYQVAESRVERIGNQEVQTLRVKLDKPVQRSARVRLLAELTRSAEQLAAPFEVAGFEVTGAVFHTGSIVIIAGPNWTVSPIDGDNVRRVRNGADSSRNKPTIARFDIVQRPSSLTLQVRPKEKRIQVSPTYKLDVSARMVHLDLKLKCTLDQALRTDLDLPLKGWTPDDLLPAKLKAADGSVETRDGLLTIPLSRLTAGPNGETEITIRAHAELPAGASSFSLPLPRPVASRFSPSTVISLNSSAVIAVAANNVELTPLVDQMPTLVEEPYATSTDVLQPWADRQQRPFLYRAGGDADLTFASKMQVHTRAITASIDAEAQVDRTQVRVDEKISLRIAYESLKSLRLVAPRQTIESQRFSVMFNEQILPISVIDAESTAERVVFDVTFPESLYDRGELQLRYSLPNGTIDASGPLNVSVVHPQLGDAVKLNRQELRLVYSEQQTAELEASDDWQATSEAKRLSGGRAQLVVSSTSSNDTARFTLRQTSPTSGGAIVVRQAWVQTWFGTANRRDRAAFRLSTPNQRITLSMPAGVKTEADGLAVAVDGQRIRDFVLTEENKVEFNNPDLTSEHLVEVWYSFDTPRPDVGSIVVTMPQVDDTSRVELFRWQLITPKNEHLLFRPSLLTAEMRWLRRGLTWGRRANLDQEQLERLIGAESYQSIPSDETNQYLFSSFEATDELRIVTVRRGWLVAMAALGVLLLGVVWLHVPQAKLPFVRLLAVVAIASLGFVYPEPALLIGQAAVVGVAVTLLVALVQWAVLRGSRSRPVIRGSTSISEDDFEYTTKEVTPSRATTASLAEPKL